MSSGPQGRRVLRWVGGLAVAGAVAACTAVPLDRGADAAEATFGPMAVRAQTVVLNSENSTQSAVGRLRYRGGLKLSAGDARFGGWSDLRVDGDGVVTLISDRGFWLQARLVHAADGSLAGFTEPRFGPLIDPRGRPLRGLQGDAEGLAHRPDGSFVVSLERQHRLLHYPVAQPPFSRAPTALPRPPGLQGAPANGGLEALGALADGRFVAIAEELYDDEDNVGWIGDGTRWDRLSYLAAPGYRPTALAGLPNGDLLVLERRFSLLGGGFAARVVRVAAVQLAAGRKLAGEEIGRFERPVAIDNFEGLAVARGPDGRLRLYILSDDNYQSLLQQTLLLSFQIDD